MFILWKNVSRFQSKCHLFRSIKDERVPYPPLDALNVGDNQSWFSTNVDIHRRGCQGRRDGSVPGVGG